MIRAKHTLYSITLLLIMITTGCSFGGRTISTTPNYYILDYLPSTENKSLVQSTPFNKTLEVRETRLPRTYDRNQIVRKKSQTQISYFSNELWANRLYDAVPNLLVRRLTAYNIFRSVSRDFGEKNPDYILESYIQNIEYIEGLKPTAFLRIEFILRDVKTQGVVFTLRNERSKVLYDTSVNYLVQSFNEMLMIETDLFAANCIEFLSGRQVLDSPRISAAQEKAALGFVDEVINLDETDNIYYGEIKLPLLSDSEMPIPFTATYLDTLDIDNNFVQGSMNEIVKLYPGRWELALGSEMEIKTIVEIFPNMRKVIEPFWSELTVHIIDESQAKVRMQYDIWVKSSNQYVFDKKLSTRTSPSEEVGEYDYLWILKPGDYMVTVNGATPSSYRDFTTVSLDKSKPYKLTMVVNPTGERSVLVGAGILEASELRGRRRVHKGAVHANLNLSSNNSIDKDNPTQSISLSGQFDNKLEYDIWPFYLTAKSLYDLGFDKTTGTEFRVNVDSYTLRNTVVFFPWKQSKVLRNMGMYGRGDLNTHFFDEFAFFQNEKNFLKVSQDQDTLIIENGKKLKVKDAFYPLQMKQGCGLTYRLNFTPNVSVNLRSGYGWQQDYENSVYFYAGDVIIDGVRYDLYKENQTSEAKGIETSVLLNAVNVLRILSITSTLDVLFPMGQGDKATKFDNENIINIKLYRNISLDIKAKVKYNKALRDYVLMDYSTFLRLSVYY